MLRIWNTRRSTSRLNRHSRFRGNWRRKATLKGLLVAGHSKGSGQARLPRHRLPPLVADRAEGTALISALVVAISPENQ